MQLIKSDLKMLNSLKIHFELETADSFFLSWKNFNW